MCFLLRCVNILLYAILLTSHQSRQRVLGFHRNSNTNHKKNKTITHTHTHVTNVLSALLQRVISIKKKTQAHGRCATCPSINKFKILLHFLLNTDAALCVCISPISRSIPVDSLRNSINYG